MDHQILAADDDPVIRTILKEMLTDAGYGVVTAADGKEALRLAERNLPDVVLLDVRMPVMDGYEACQRLKQAHEGFLPVILITGETDDPFSRVKANEVDADDFLIKPFRQDELLARVSSLLRLKRLIADKRQQEVERARLETELQMERFRREEETRRQAFYSEVIRAVTGGKLLLVDREAFEEAILPLLESPDRASLDLQGPASVSEARRMAEAMGTVAGLDEDRLHNLVISISEAATNVVKHAGRGHITMASDEKRIMAAIEDDGPGIDSQSIVSATLVRGYSTAVSLGMGFTMMLEMMDRVSVRTGPGGTSVLLELNLAPISEEELLESLIDSKAW